MPKKLPEARVFALKGYTVKSTSGKWFCTPTGLDRWSGPYTSLHHCTTAIARRLSREFTERNDRLDRVRGVTVSVRSANE